MIRKGVFQAEFSIDYYGSKPHGGRLGSHRPQADSELATCRIVQFYLSKEELANPIKSNDKRIKSLARSTFLVTQ